MKDGAFGELLREFRIAASLSQEALAEKARLTPGAISALERSARRGPQHQTLSLLAEALALDPAQRAVLEEAAGAGRKRPVRGTQYLRAAAPSVETADNLPASLTSFHGRERELGDVRTLVANRRIVTLLGTGGVGKTRLALECSRALAGSRDFGDGVWFVDLAPLATGDLVTTAIARVLGVREEPGTALLDTLGRALAGKRALVVLDNCEHLLDACAAVTERLTQETSHLRFLTTTREALRLAGESVYRIESLPVAAGDGAGPALDLLLDRLIDADFTAYSNLRETERAAAVTICRRLDGIPLALELAAGRARDLSLTQIVAGLDERFDLLTSGPRTATPRQSTLRGMIDWSFELLEPGERALFARLGLFAAAFTPEAALDICSSPGIDVRDALAGLIAKSLVGIVQDRDGRLRYRLLETVRAFAIERLKEREEYDAYAARFAASFCQRAVAADATYGRIPKGDFLASVEPDLENYRSALTWTLESANDIRLGAELAGAMGWIYRQTALYAEGIRWADLALEHAALIVPRTQGRLHMALSYFYFNIGDMKTALDAAVRAASAFRTAGARSDLAWALTQRAYCSYRYNRIDDVRFAAEEAVAIARDENDSFRLAGALNAYALTIPAERAEERIAALEESIRYSKASGDEDALVPSAHLAAAFYEADRFEQAYRSGLDVVDVCRRNPDRATLAAALVNLTAYALALDDTDGAHAAAREGLSLVADLGKTLNAMCLLQHLGSIAARRRDFSTAATLVGASDARYREFQFEREITEQQLYERTISEIKAGIGDDALAENLRAGERLSIENAIALGLALPAQRP